MNKYIFAHIKFRSINGGTKQLNVAVTFPHLWVVRISVAVLFIPSCKWPLPTYCQQITEIFRLTESCLMT